MNHTHSETITKLMSSVQRKIKVNQLIIYGKRNLFSFDNHYLIIFNHKKLILHHRCRRTKAFSSISPLLWSQSYKRKQNVHYGWISIVNKFWCCLLEKGRGELLANFPIATFCHTFFFHYF